MPWIKATLRGQTVFARADDGGNAERERKMGESRFATSRWMGRRTSRARETSRSRAPTCLPDETCGAAEAPRTEGRGERSRGRKERKLARARVEAPNPRALEIKPLRRPLQADPIPKDAPSSPTPMARARGIPGLAGSGSFSSRPMAPMRESYEYLGEGTNNIAELTADHAGGAGRSARCACRSSFTPTANIRSASCRKDGRRKANQALILGRKKSSSRRTGKRASYTCRDTQACRSTNAPTSSHVKRFARAANSS